METALDSNWFGLLSLVVLVAILGSVLYFNVRKPDQKEAAAYADLSRRRGWRVQRHMASGGKGYRVEVDPSDGNDWSCLVTRYFNMPTTVLTTEFRMPAARISEGMVVIGPAIPEAEAAMAERLLGGLEGVIARLFLQDIEDDGIFDHLADLRHAGPVALQGATVFATASADPTAIAQVFAPHLQRWTSTHRDDKAFPILIITPRGLILRMRLDAAPLQLEGFIDMALAVAEGLPN